MTILNKKRKIRMKQISKEEINKLYKHNFIFNTKRGVVNDKGDSVGFYRTQHRWFIEDRYVDIAKSL
jgi:hypothetical protein